MPVTAFAHPVTRNSRFQSRSSSAAASRPPRFITTHTSVTVNRTSRFGIWPATSVQSMYAKSEGPTGGHICPPDETENSRPAVRASSADIPNAASPS